MRIFFLLALSTLASRGCTKPDRSRELDAGPVAEAPSPIAPSASSPSPIAPTCTIAIDDRRAAEILAKKPEVAKELRGAKKRLLLVSAARCDDADAGLDRFHVFALGDEGDDPRTLWDGFRVNATTGEATARSMCQGRDFISWDEWKREERATDGVWELPEVEGFGRSIRAASDGKVWTVIRLERCPTLSEPDEKYSYYVGERHEDHTVRWMTFAVDPKTFAYTVYDMMHDRWISYAAWSATKEAQQYAAGGFPRTGRGGALDYGVPDKTVSEVATWKHPTKHVVAELGEIEKVELYATTYPVFFVKSASAAPPSIPIAFGDRALAANGWWPFEIVVAPSGARFRHTGDAWQTLDAGAWVTLARRAK